MVPASDQALPTSVPSPAPRGSGPLPAMPQPMSGPPPEKPARRPPNAAAMTVPPVDDAAGGGPLPPLRALNRPPAKWTDTPALSGPEVGQRSLQQAGAEPEPEPESEPEPEPELDSWQFAVVFGRDSRSDESPQQFEEFLTGHCRTFHGAGFQLAIVQRTPQTRDKVIVLLRMSAAAMIKEFRRVQIERWKETGAGVEFQHAADATDREKQQWGLGARGSSICEKIRPTKADVVQIIADVLSNRCALGDLEHLHDRFSDKADSRINACFPLKNREWEEEFMGRWMREGGVVKSCKRIGVEFRTKTGDLVRDANNIIEKTTSQSAAIVRAADQAAVRAAYRAKDAAHQARDLGTKVVKVAGSGVVAGVKEVKNVGSGVMGSVVSLRQGRTIGPAAAGAVDEEIPSAEDSDQQGSRSRSPSPTAADLGQQKRNRTANLAKHAKHVTIGAIKLAQTTRTYAGDKAKEARDQAKAGAKATGTLVAGTAQFGVRTLVGVTETGFGVIFGFKDFVHRLAVAFWTRDDVFVFELRENYGDQVGIYFAFCNNYSNSLMPLTVLLIVYYAVARTIDWMTYLRGLGLLGLLVASVWGPMVIINWQRRANGLLFSWNLMDTDELPQLNPFCDKSKSEFIHGQDRNSRLRKLLLYTSMIVILALLVTALFAVNFMIIYTETQLLWAPICGTHVAEAFAVDTKAHLVDVGCLQTTSTNPLSFGDRSLYILALDIFAGLMIDVVYVEIFGLLAEVFVKMLHIPGKKEYEETRIGIMFPFHWGSYMFYFLLLTAYVPFGRTIVELVTDVTDTFDITSASTDAGALSGPTSANANVSYDASTSSNISAVGQGDVLHPDDYWKFWTYQLRMTLELDSALVGPLVIAVWAEFAFGQLMPWLAYVRMKFMIRWRGYRLSRCASCIAKLSCCCCEGGDGTETLTEAIFDGSSHLAQVGRGSYAGLVQRISLALGAEAQTPVEVELITGTWGKSPSVMGKKTKSKQNRFNRERARKGISGALAASFEEDGRGQLKQPSDRVRTSQNAEAETEWALAERQNKAGQEEDNGGEEALGASLRADSEAANAIYLESQLPILDLTTEYLQLVQQFAYVTLFTVLWALAPLMNFMRLVWEANADANTMFKYYRRPVPRRIPTPSTIGAWENMMWLQVYLACVLTSWFFVFCTGEMEAWSALFSSIEPSQDQLKSGDWSGCQPIANNYRFYWRHENCYDDPTNTSAGAERVAWDTWVDGLADDEVFTEFANVMAPNVDCWEDRKVDNTLEMCDQPSSSATAGRMSEGQISSRVMMWLVINHAQFFCVWLTSRLFPDRPIELREQVKDFSRRQKELLAEVIFQESVEEVSAWRKVRRTVLSLQAMKSKTTTRREIVRQGRKSTTTSVPPVGGRHRGTVVPVDSLGHGAVRTDSYPPLSPSPAACP